MSQISITCVLNVDFLILTAFLTLCTLTLFRWCY